MWGIQALYKIFIQIYLCNTLFISQTKQRNVNLCHLHKDGEEDDCDDGSEEQVLDLTVGQQEPQRECDGATEPTVSNDKLVLFG